MISKLIKRTVISTLKEVINKIENDTCELTEEEAMEIMSVISHTPLSKDEACSHVNISRSRFDELIRLGKLPKGRKRRGFKEKIWYKDELDEFIKKNR